MTSDDPHHKIGMIIDAAKEETSVVNVDFKPKSAQGDPCKEGMPREPSRSRQAQSGGGDDGPAGPRTMGFSIEDLNREFALVLMGSKAVVFLEQPQAPLEDKKRIIVLDGFLSWFANRFTEVVDRASGKVKSITWGKAWHQSKDRRQYRGIEFFPDPENKPGTKGYLNLWSGFAVVPAKEPDPLRYKTFRDHLLTNVCGGDEAVFRWVFGFFAHMVQRPRERPDTAIVMQGEMGSGKTKVGEVIGSLFPQHYFLVDDPRYVTGNFNAHMATCLLLQADEAVWAGDKKAEGRIKGLVTAKIQQIEHKGVDSIRLPNFVRLFLTSNEPWVVPAGKDERRWCVLEVDARCAQNHEYFAEMDQELANGGREHLLADLLAFDLASINVRQIPRTAALLTQKIHSFQSVDSWWFERLMSGTSTHRDAEWKLDVPTDALFEDYVLFSEKIGIKRKQEPTKIGMALSKLMPPEMCPEFIKHRASADIIHNGYPVAQRVYCYRMPSLEKARAAFSSVVGQDVTWPSDGPNPVSG